MKIITWNCNMAYRKKAGVLLQYKPDIVVVQECEHPDKLVFPAGIAKPTGMVWIGSNHHKGLGIFSYSSFTIGLIKTHNPDIRLIAPLKISNGPYSITLLAIWAHNPLDKDGQYITQVWKALAHYKKIIQAERTVLIGDFNSNAIWDRPRRKGNHSHVVEELARKNIHSVYHSYFNQQQGKETAPTHYLYRHKERPYHLDYCFASADLINCLQSVEVGDYETWRPHSDHVPLIVSFDM
jgi:exodeoxyribonuclease III